MQNKIDHLILLFGGLFLFFLDQFLKYLAYSKQNVFFVWNKLIGWEFYANKGIAFSLPFPNTILLIFTPIIIFLLITYYLKTKNQNILLKISLLLIILGAISNFIDRIIFGITIDYFRIFTIVINLADIMIVFGVLLLMFKNKK
ncbi:MAG: hypothetical protein A2725_02435 [Candidatus Magasanikbacteria bacterium RIFCSPHIGHO2_01_FULL_33_34]|uniref:Lipoprotein signal peptidase n=1 Tax=Candidatus Magasanikbacteria bacterium RIFCSPHIGHO2_01_FULL_33_34 TaxID=1798671 RepID=A0A1F6LKC0_9BACT|nr:MAG: hypothetical protein A2725_02435 [Candidatus Magasanikbacteria bacterium RIFCSPHIGHO2_01_FULL_33_34]OGH65621.1 MAG: hypothetical protein A3B83_01965 [Candidatus Magasanikbacteria bacterium RIFCSPHIGHO2_02_FULL_33_17]OGH75830.1 MAG: hypothetical protein A3A89_02860 [Candidatus Magasanikbacteria bacterium RIFCSPLOWO2_01_FULL_33_34]OGH81158.1 MAG: hypothetical protein A3F93_01790 [Candidatus Magasanikbacteria bacterium RIFCSPLOWO2_12_FULL_34_7]